jgi:K+-transporting ATPase ATPase A chain
VVRMTVANWIQLVLYLMILLALVKPLGAYMARVYQGDKTPFTPILRPVERLFYRLAGVDEAQSMNWKTYAAAMLIFNTAGLLVVYALQRLQGFLPFNPQRFGAVSADSALNTAISFASNTNWQGYGGETTMSYLTQMLGLTVQNFVSAATGMAVLIALIRGFVSNPGTGNQHRDTDAGIDCPNTEKNNDEKPCVPAYSLVEPVETSHPSDTHRFRQAQPTQMLCGSVVNNFWVDLTRSVLYILLPLSLILALLLVSQGVVQTFASYQPVSTLQGGRQQLAVGPAASQIAIKQLGTNGGGFFNANSAHPFENPTPFSNLLEMLAILLIPASLCYTFGKMVGDTRQGWAILTTMTILFVVLLGATVWAEQAGNPLFTRLGLDQTASHTNPGGNMEGKEVRFGIANSALWAAATTAASNGSVNAMHDSFTPLGGLIPMWLMQLGEIIYGGVGSGLYGMLAFVIVAVFVSGLMVGRTPEYLGKKIEAYEMKMASLMILIPVLTVLIGTAIAVMTPADNARLSGTATIFNPGAHGFSEVLYAFSSAGNNNGSAFAGLGANTLFYNIALGIAMLIARYWLAIPALAIAGSLVGKKKVPTSPGTLPTHTPLFVFWLIGVIVIVGALSFLPALALGPIVEAIL